MKKGTFRATLSIALAALMTFAATTVATAQLQDERDRTSGEELPTSSPGPIADDGGAPADGSGDPLRNFDADGSSSLPDPDPTNPDTREDDVDRDGVADAFDNCLVHANTQIDADLDGYGNACDADFNNDGEVNFEDRDRIERALRYGTSDPRDERLMDLDENGVFDDRDMDVFDDLEEREVPGPVQDEDEDGTPDKSDRCGSTPHGARRVTADCAAIDVAQHPDALTAPVAALVVEIAGAMAEQDDKMGAYEHLIAAESLVHDAARGAEENDPCAAVDPLQRAGSELGSARAEIERLATMAENDIPSDDRSLGDIPEEEMKYLNLKFDAKWIADAERANDEAMLVFEETCALMEPVEGAGVVKRIDDLRGHVVLESGETIAFDTLDAIDGVPIPGGDVRYTGNGFGDGMISAESIAPGFLDVDLSYLACAQLRFAPIQRFADWGGIHPPELLHPDAYIVGERYRFEEGMRLAAVSTCGPSDTLSTEFDRYTLKIRAKAYASASQTTPSSSKVIALDLTPGDTPVPLPDYLYDNVYEKVELVVETVKSTCSIVSFPDLSCSAPVKILERTYEIERRDRGSLCVLSYYATDFAIDDQKPGAWDQTWINNIVYLMASDTPTHFEAQGYEMCQASGGGWKPCPTSSTIYAPNHSFTLKANDSYPTYYIDDATVRENLYRITGVERAAGLRWPRLEGTRNGHTWQVSCKPPRVVRDRLAFCSGGTDTFYRLPFAQSDGGSWQVTQGNLSGGTNSHATAYALDMAGSCGDRLRASRTGTVVEVVDDRTCMNHVNASYSTPTCGSLRCTQAEIDAGMHGGNYVRIRHQDDTYGLYLHMKPNGVSVSKGNLVWRGKSVGFVGTTGRSSGPHLHWESEDLQTTSHLSLYEATDPNDFQKKVCYEPQAGDALISTNTP